MDGPRKKIRIGEAASAIGSTAKAVRHWISRYADKGLTPTAEQTGTWLEFSWGDVAALGVTKYFVDLGMPAYDAFDVATSVIQRRWPGLYLDDPHFTSSPNTALLSCYLTRDGSWRFGSLEQSATADVFDHPIERMADGGRVIITVSVIEIIWDAIDALKDMGHPPPTYNASPPNQIDQYGNALQREAVTNIRNIKKRT